METAIWLKSKNRQNRIFAKFPWRCLFSSDLGDNVYHQLTNLTSKVAILWKPWWYNNAVLSRKALFVQRRWNSILFRDSVFQLNVRKKNINLKELKTNVIFYVYFSAIRTPKRRLHCTTIESMKTVHLKLPYCQKMTAKYVTSQFLSCAYSLSKQMNLSKKKDL